VKKQYEHRDVQAEITDLMIAHIEENRSLPYQKEWNPALCGTILPPHNPVTGTVYSGQNFWVLGLSKEAIASDDYRFVTFAQAIEKGWSIKKGSKSLPVVYSEPRIARDADGGEQEVSPDRPSGRFMGMFSKTYRVFHSSMVEGMPEPERMPVDPVTWTVPAGVQSIIDNSGVEIIERGSQAYYSRLTKAVTVPPKNSFIGKTDQIKAANHAAVILHELQPCRRRSTGHGEAIQVWR
jgi:antirestriction protein ArdC